MISCSSTLASSAPATSAKVSFGVSPVRSFALDLPKEKARLPPDWSWRSRKNQSPRITIHGSAASSRVVRPPFCSRAVTATPASSSRSSSTSLLATGRSTVKLLAARLPAETAVLNSPLMVLPSKISIVATLPASSWRLNSVYDSSVVAVRCFDMTCQRNVPTRTSMAQRARFLLRPDQPPAGGFCKERGAISHSDPR